MQKKSQVTPSMGADEIHSMLEQRLGRVHARQRLGIEREHEAQVFGQGLNFFHIENLTSSHVLIRAILIMTGLYWRGLRNAKQVRVTHNTIRSLRLPTPFKGFTVLQISDLHVDMNLEVVKQVKSLVDRLHYDVCVLTGDFRGNTFGPFEATLRGMAELRDALREPIYGVLGNHDVYALLTRSGRWPRKRDTLDELFAAPDADELLARLRALPVLAHLPGPVTAAVPDVWVVHGGLDPRWTELAAVAAVANALPHDDAWLTSPTVNFATRVRCCTATGERSKFDRDPAECPPPYRPWDQFYRGTALVVHGHWAWRGHYRNPPDGPRTMGLDSGCVYGGELTAWCQEEDRVVQVKAAKAY